MVQIDVRGAPGQSQGVPGSISGLKPRRTGPQILICTPSFLRRTLIEIRGLFLRGPVVVQLVAGRPPRESFLCESCSPAIPDISEGIWLRLKTGHLKAVGQQFVGPVFMGFRPETDPGSPLDRRGSPGTSICIKNQPRRPTLRPFRGHSIFLIFLGSFIFLGFFKPLKGFFLIFLGFFKIPLSPQKGFFDFLGFCRIF